MVSFADIQNAYNKLYAELRKYVWDFPVVAALADVEIAVYRTCQNLPDIRAKYYRLKSMITDILYEDDDLKKRLSSFEKLINKDQTYVKLNQVEEVIQL